MKIEPAIKNKEIVVVHIEGKATVMSPYLLSEKDLEKVKEKVPELKNTQVVNLVDKNIYAGCIVKVGSKLIDLTLNGALQNLKKQIYESY